MTPDEMKLYTVPRDATLEVAFAVIEANRHRCAIVVDDGGHVVGTVSDGDGRRAMLAHRLLSAPVDSIMNLNFVSLTPGTETRARELSERLRVHVFPVVGPENELLDIVTT